VSPGEVVHVAAVLVLFLLRVFLIVFLVLDGGVHLAVLSRVRLVVDGGGWVCVVGFLRVHAILPLRMRFTVLSVVGVIVGVVVGVAFLVDVALTPSHLSRVLLSLGVRQHSCGEERMLRCRVLVAVERLER
jgi:hypothetical protein